MKTRAGLFEMINKIGNPLARLTQKQKGLKIRKRNIKTDTTEGQRIIRDYSEKKKKKANKLVYLKGVDMFLET